MLLYAMSFELRGTCLWLYLVLNAVESFPWHYSWLGLCLLFNIDQRGNVKSLRCSSFLFEEAKAASVHSYLLVVLWTVIILPFSVS
jgi:hypothetical protein